MKLSAHALVSVHVVESIDFIENLHIVRDACIRLVTYEIFTGGWRISGDMVRSASVMTEERLHSLKASEDKRITAKKAHSETQEAQCDTQYVVWLSMDCK